MRGLAKWLFLVAFALGSPVASRAAPTDTTTEAALKPCSDCKQHLKICGGILCLLGQSSCPGCVMALPAPHGHEVGFAAIPLDFHTLPSGSLRNLDEPPEPPPPRFEGPSRHNIIGEIS